MNHKILSHTNPSPTTSTLEMVDRDFLNSTEAAFYLHMSLNQLYKLNSAGAIPYYKPRGGRVYYQRSELQDWILKGRRATVRDINSAAIKSLTIKHNRQ